MPVSPEFLNEILARLEPVGDVSSRATFGGQGLFIDGKMFADPELLLEAARLAVAASKR